MKKNKQEKTQISLYIFIIVSILICMFVLSGCSIKTNMPFNGDVSFFKLSIKIPEDFIRDSTKSDDNRYVFEKDNYDVIIMLFMNYSNGYSLRNIVNNAPKENGTVLNCDEEYNVCDIEYILEGGVYSFAHSQIYDYERYQIVVQSKDEAKAKEVYDNLMLNYSFSENE